MYQERYQNPIISYRYSMDRTEAVVEDRAAAELMMMNRRRHTIMAWIHLLAPAIALSSRSKPYQRGPWQPNPHCPDSIVMDPPRHYRLSPPGCKFSEYAYFADAKTVAECVEKCCGDWSCWAFSYYPVGKVGNNKAPEGPGYSCNGTTPCCVLLNDMHDPVLASNSTYADTQSGVRGKLPARWNLDFEASTVIGNVSFGDRLYFGTLTGKKIPNWWEHGEGGSLGDEFPTTWAHDGMQYSGAGDNDGGGGLSGGSPLTLWRIDGRDPPNASFYLQGSEKPIVGSAVMQACPIGKGSAPNLKSQSLLALDSKLYWAVACFDYDDPDLRQGAKRAGLDPVFNRQRYGVNDTSWIVVSEDLGRTWDIQATDFHFFKGRWSSPRFINAGQNYEAAEDPGTWSLKDTSVLCVTMGHFFFLFLFFWLIHTMPFAAHVYAVFVGTETDKAYFEQNDAIWLGRVPRTQILNRTAWRFYAGQVAGEPAWTADDTIAVSIFRHPLMTATQQVTYNAGLKRYMMAVWGCAQS
eukprot:SAG31_NODE_707_length_12684_cov_16.884863_11_plen_521_part_00